MGWLKTGLLVVLLAFTFHRVYFFLVDMGVGVHHNNVHPGPCRVVPGITCGSEQISVTEDGLAFITSGYRGLTKCNLKYIRGHLYMFDFKHPDENVTRLQIVGTGVNLDTFDPHGMDILEGVGGNGNIVHVYVVNHGHVDGVDSVEVFRYDRTKAGEITHIRTILDEKFVCINDLALLGEDHFYITNLHKYCRVADIMQSAEYLLGVKSANILHYQQGKSSIMQEGYNFNGITLSKSKNEVLVNQGGKKKVDVFQIDHSNGQLSLKNSVFIGYNLDNIFLDKQTGDFYVAFFKNILGLPDAAANKTDFCGTSGAVLSVQDSDVTNIEVEEVFHDNGEKFVCAASAFVHYKGQYLLGTIFDKLGYCIRK